MLTTNEERDTYTADHHRQDASVKGDDAFARQGSSQSKDAINVVEHLLAGQLEGKERQARNSGVTPERFKDLIGDRPYDLLKHIDGESSAPPRPSAVPAGSAYSPSRKMWKTPGGALFDANGKPVGQ